MMICRRYLLSLRRAIHVSNVGIGSTNRYNQGIAWRDISSRLHSYRMLSTLVDNHNEEMLDHSKREDFFVAIPEIPSDTPENNEILRYVSESNGNIDFSKLDFEKCYLALGKTMGEFSNLVETLSYVDNNENIIEDPKKFFMVIEEGLYKMDTAYQIMYLMYHVRNSEFSSLNGNELPQKCMETRRKIFESDKIVDIIKNMNKLSSQYEHSVQKMLEMYVNESSNYGFALRIEAKNIMDNIESHLKMHLQSMHENRHNAATSFVRTIDDPDILKAVTPELSTDDSTHHKLRTPLDVNINNCSLFVKLCPDTDVRRTFFRTLNRLCSPGGSPRYNNYRIIENIRIGRRRIADSFRYRNYFEFKRREAHTQSTDLILTTLSKLNEINIKLYHEKLAELRSFASSLDDDSYDGEIEEADLEYWIHRFKQEKILECKERDINRMFPHTKVIQGLQNFLRDYFDIVMDQVTISGSCMWNEDVTMFKVSYKSEVLGSFYYDPSANLTNRASSCTIGRLRGRSDRLGCRASLYLNKALRKSSSNETCMSSDDIRNLFHGVGLVVQELLNNYEFYELNLKGPFKADTNRILPNLFVTWLLKDPRIMQSCSYDQRSGKQLNRDLIKRILNTMTYFNSIHTSHELFKSHLDIELNTSTSDLAKIAKKIHSIYKPLPYDPTTFPYCSDLDLHTSRTCFYYGEVWSKILATECFEVYNNPDDVSTANHEIIRQMSDRIITSLYDLEGDDHIIDRLSSITGNGFKFSKPSLGVL